MKGIPIQSRIQAIKLCIVSFIKYSYEHTQTNLGREDKQGHRRSRFLQLFAINLLLEYRNNNLIMLPNTWLRVRRF